MIYNVSLSVSHKFTPKTANIQSLSHATVFIGKISFATTTFYALPYTLHGNYNAPSQEQNRAMSVRVLVIDDSPTVTRIASEMLGEAGYSVTITETFEDALDEHVLDTVSVILTDLILPGMGGIEGIARIKSTRPNIGIIAMSAGDASTDPQHLLRAARGVGADAIVKKPFDKDILASAVQQALDASAAASLDKRKILVIDDSRTMCKLVSNMLPRTDFSVQTSQSFENAITSNEIMAVDVVITDIFMPGIGGIEAIRGIKTNWPDVKIVAMSGGFDEAMMSSTALQAAEKVGADAALAKPFTDTALLSTINTICTSI